VIQRSLTSAVAGAFALLAACGLAHAGAAAPAAKPATTMHHAAPTRAPVKPGPIREQVVIAASPDLVYQALLDSTQFAAATHMPAAIDTSVGGTFHCFKGMIEGRNLELVPGRRIVNAWRVYDWPAGVYSIVRFNLAAEGAGTRLVITHAGWEDGEPRAALEKGWTEHYLAPFKQYLATAK